MQGFLSGLQHVLEHAATIIVGFVLTIIGLAMTFSLVFAVPGMFVLVIGLAIFVAGVFSHPTRRAHRA